MEPVVPNIQSPQVLASPDDHWEFSSEVIAGEMERL
jgi:hypothetical protein